MLAVDRQPGPVKESPEPGPGSADQIQLKPPAEFGTLGCSIPAGSSRWASSSAAWALSRYPASASKSISRPP